MFVNIGEFETGGFCISFVIIFSGFSQSFQDLHCLFRIFTGFSWFSPSFQNFHCLFMIFTVFSGFSASFQDFHHLLRIFIIFSWFSLHYQIGFSHCIFFCSLDSRNKVKNRCLFGKFSDYHNPLSSHWLGWGVEVKLRLHD